MLRQDHVLLAEGNLISLLLYESEVQTAANLVIDRLRVLGLDFYCRSISLPVSLFVTPPVVHLTEKVC
jgi:hypothetical protein